MLSDDDGPTGNRALLIDATVKLLRVSGPAGVKAREAAAAAGFSTMTLYSEFGGMPELMSATADEGFRRLERILASSPVSDDPSADLFRMALACREMAQDNPHLYDLMFGLSTRGSYRAAATGRSLLSGRSASFRSAFTHFVNACERLVVSRRIQQSPTSSIAAQLWSFVHGFITLEIAGHFEMFDDPVAEVLLPLARNVMMGMGDTSEQVSASGLLALRTHEALPR